MNGYYGIYVMWSENKICFPQVLLEKVFVSLISENILEASTRSSLKVI